MPAVIVLYLSRRTEVEDIREEVGDGIPLTDIGRDLTLDSRFGTVLLVPAGSRGGTTVTSLEIELRSDLVDFFLLITAGSTFGFTDGTLAPFCGLASTIAPRLLPTSLSSPFLTSVKINFLIWKIRDALGGRERLDNAGVERSEEVRLGSIFESEDFRGANAIKAVFPKGDFNSLSRVKCSPLEVIFRRRSSGWLKLHVASIRRKFPALQNEGYLT